MSNEIGEVKLVVDAWRNAINSGNIDKLLSLTTDDIEMMLPGQSAVSGDDAREFLRGFVGNFTVNLQPFTNEEFVVSGDWAYQRLTYELTLSPKDGGEVIAEKGDGIHMFRRESDGAWKLAKDISTSY